MIIQPKLLKSNARRLRTEVFICGAGYQSQGVVIRDKAREALIDIDDVVATYGEELEKKSQYRKKSTDLQTLETRFAHNVDFTLLILQSPGSIAELGTFTQMPGIRGRLIVLVPDHFYREESYINRGPLSLLSKDDPNSVIYFNMDDEKDFVKRVRYPLTFYKYAHYVRRREYLYKVRMYSKGELSSYVEYIDPVRVEYHQAITIISIIVGEEPTYADLLLLSGLAPTQLSTALSGLFEARKVIKVGSGRYKSLRGLNDPLLMPFSSTAISKCKAVLNA